MLVLPNEMAGVQKTGLQELTFMSCRSPSFFVAQCYVFCASLMCSPGPPTVMSDSVGLSWGFQPSVSVYVCAQYVCV